MKIAAVLMAAGASSRFGECKLIKKFASRPMFEYALDALPYNKLCAIAVVSGRAEILAAAEARGFIQCSTIGRRMARRALYALAWKQSAMRRG